MTAITPTLIILGSGIVCRDLSHVSAFVRRSPNAHSIAFVPHQGGGDLKEKTYGNDRKEISLLLRER